MKKNLLIVLCVIFYHYTYSQYCTSGGALSNIDSNTESVNLIGSGGSAIVYTGCPGVVGVEDQTAGQQVVLNVGNSYVAYVQFGTCGDNYAGFGEAWIDFNNNQIFETTESIGSWQGTPPTSLSAFNFTVPSMAINGNVRMRVMQSEDATSLPLDPCATFNWGSVVDFSVSLQNGVGCAGYYGDNIADAIEVAAYPYADTNSTAVCYSSYSYVYSSPDVFYLAVLDPTKDSLKVSLCDSDFDTHLSIQNTSGDVIFYNDDHAACSPHSEILFPTSGLDSVYIIVEGWNYLTGNYILTIDHDYTNSVLHLENLPENKYTYTVYPNPAVNRIHIKDVLPESIDVYSVSGSKMQVHGQNSSSVDISVLPAGIYLLEFVYKGHYFREKFVKQ